MQKSVRMVSVYLKNGMQVDVRSDVYASIASYVEKKAVEKTRRIDMAVGVLVGTVVIGIVLAIIIH